MIATKRSKPAWKRAWNSGPTAASSTSRKRPAGGSAANQSSSAREGGAAALDPVAGAVVGGRDLGDQVVEQLWWAARTQSRRSLEDFVEALAADPGGGEDVGDGGRLVAALGGDPGRRRDQPLALRAGRRRRGRGPCRPRGRPGAAWSRACAHAAARPLGRQPRLAQRLVVSGERGGRQVDDVGHQRRQVLGPPGGDLVEDQQLGAAEGEARARVLARLLARPHPERFHRRDRELPVTVDPARVDADHVAAQDQRQRRLGGEQLTARRRSPGGSPRRASRTPRRPSPVSPTAARCTA